MAYELNKGVACFMVPIQVLAGSKGDYKGRWTPIGSGCLRKGVPNQRPMQLKSSKPHLHPYASCSLICSTKSPCTLYIYKYICMYVFLYVCPY